jgi:hypothetical protein
MKKILAVVALAGGLACSRSSRTQSSEPSAAAPPPPAPAAVAPVAPVVAATTDSSAATHAADTKSGVTGGRKAVSHKHRPHRKKSSSHA